MSKPIHILPKWEVVKLPDIAELKNGGTPPKAKSKYWEGGKIPFVTAADLTTLYIDNGRTFLTEEGLASGKTVICEEGDLLIGTRTSVGNCSIVKRRVGASQDITRARFFVAVVPEYFCWFFRNIAEYVAFFSQGTSIQGITRNVLNSIEIAIPPLDEQHRIVKRIEELNNLADEMRKLLNSINKDIENFQPALLAKAFRGEL